nr:hypothetical protein BaRGS_021564 [Batillaria attramentaria]
MAEYVGEPFHPVTKVIFVLVGFVVLLSGVLGNGLLLVVLGRYRPLWQAHNVFIASLALADLLIICTGIAPTIFDLILGYHPVANEVHCRVNACILTASCYVSVMSLVGISLNRYMRVCHTQRFFAWFSLRKNVIICLCLWTLGIYAVVSALDSVYGVPAELVEAASILLAANSAVNWIIYGAMNTSYRQAYAHILPCCKRYRPLWQAHNVFIASLTVADLLIVSVAIPHVLLDLVLGYHPVHSEYAAVAFVDSVVGLPAEVVAAATLLLCVNSAINWIIYGAMNTSYKQAYAQTLPCCKRCDQSSGGE